MATQLQLTNISYQSQIPLPSLLLGKLHEHALSIYDNNELHLILILINMTETQNGFRKGRSCTNPTFCLKLLIEKRREFNLEKHLLFIDYEKTFEIGRAHV
jgi:hypothetical protein